MLTFYDFFAGLGGFRLGMEQAGHKCLGHCEIDKFANIAYAAIHQPREDEFFATDIRAVVPGNLPGADVYCAGFPCQAFSIAGKRGGFEDTRGTLFFEVLRLANVRKPKYLFFENVAGLLSHDKGRTFYTMLTALWECGYDCQWQVLNSKNFGVPQNRERVFIVGHLRGQRRPEVFPIECAGGEVDERFISTTVDANYFKGIDNHGARTGIMVYQKTHSRCTTEKQDKTGTLQSARLDKIPAIVRPVLTPDRPEKRQNGRRFKDDGDEMFTLTAQDSHGVMIQSALNHSRGFETRDDGISHCIKGAEGGSSKNFISISYDLKATQNSTRRGAVKQNEVGALDTQCNVGINQNAQIRRLTPRECFRLQAFPDWAFDRCREAGLSDSQLYKLAGNSVTVSVIYEIARRL